MMLHEQIALALYLVMIPLVVWGTRQNGASMPTALTIGITWPLATLIAVIWVGISS